MYKKHVSLKKKAPKWIDKIEIKKPLLDIGCAYGFLLSKGKEIIGIDIFPELVKEAKMRGTVIMADAHFLPFKNGVFKKIVIWHVLEHLENPLIALREINRVIANDGNFLCAVPNASMYIFERKTHIYSWSESSLMNLLKKGGFVEIRVRGIYQRYLGYGAGQRIIKGIPNLESILARIHVILFSTNFRNLIATAKKR